MHRFQRVQQAAARHLGRSGDHGAPVAVLADGGRGDVLHQPVGIGERGHAGRREVAFARRVRTLAVVEAADQLRDQEVQVGPALAVGVAALVDRHAVDPGREVGAVVEVEAAQVELVGLAFAAVLAGDQSGRDFEQLAGAIGDAAGQVLRAGTAGAGRIGDPELGGAGAFDQHALELEVVGMDGGRGGQRGQRAGDRTKNHGVREGVFYCAGCSSAWRVKVRERTAPPAPRLTVLTCSGRKSISTPWRIVAARVSGVLSSSW